MASCGAAGSRRRRGKGGRLCAGAWAEEGGPGVVVAEGATLTRAAANEVWTRSVRRTTSSRSAATSCRTACSSSSKLGGATTGAREGVRAARLATCSCKAATSCRRAPSSEGRWEPELLGCCAAPWLSGLAGPLVPARSAISSDRVGDCGSGLSVVGDCGLGLSVLGRGGHGRWKPSASWSSCEASVRPA